ncbi:MFS transporter [Fictibacillus fluitans]|uniref:MFS transporter n=1 Tax=Fictibacillus fluitans TaxID=3058422 RepID=A0ABT8HUV8_9BACL|nr:MFS transporter [Fictibacillus sp. NE201]MDN4524560.1 MFS transporter [Fictibacillus sp. NE201]
MATTLAQEQRMVRKQRFGGILANRQFLFLWIASIFTGLSFSIYLISETWFVLQALKAPSKLGIIMMLTTIPRVLLMAVGGVMADSIKRSHIILITNSTRGLLVLGLAVLILNHSMNLYLLGAFALLFGVLDAFFWPANQSMLPTLVKKEQIVRANSLVQTTNQLSLLTGPVIAGFMIKFGSFFGVFVCTSMLLFCSSILIGQIRHPENPSTVSKQKEPVFRQLKEGIIYVRTVPYLLLTMFTSIFVNLLLVGPLNIGLPLMVDQQLKGDVLSLSYLESSLALGMVAGAFLTGILNIKSKRPIISLSLIAVLSFLNIFLSQMTALWHGILILSLAGICLSISNIIAPSLVQEMTEKRMMGRVQSLMSTASMGFIPLSFALVSALLSSGLPIDMIILYSSIALTLFVLTVLWRSKIIRTID